MKKTLVATTVATVLALSACTDNKPAAPEQSAAAPADAAAAKAEPATAAVAAENPLLKRSALQYQAPEFDKIKTEHFLPAMLRS